MKKKVLGFALIALFGLSSIASFGRQAKERDVLVGHLCMHNFEGECNYGPDENGEDIILNGAFWV